MNSLPVERRSSYPVPAKERARAERKAVKPDSDWSIIAGLHAEGGDLAIVWLGWDRESHKDTGQIHLYDSWVFRRDESLPFIVDAIKQRGEWIELAYTRNGEEIASKLADKGCRVLRGSKLAIEGYSDSEELAAWDSREINDRLNAGTFIVWDTNEDWLREYEHYREKDGSVPDVGFPLMAATRVAFHKLKKARKRPETKRRQRAPLLGIV